MERAVREVDLRVRCREVEGGRDLFMSQRVDGVDEARHAGRDVKVPEVSLDRPERAERPGAGPATERPSECGELDRVAERRGRAVRLEIGDGLRVDPRDGVSHRDDNAESVT